MLDDTKDIENMYDNPPTDPEEEEEETPQPEYVSDPL